MPPGLNDGSAWENAYNCLQDALAVASAGTEIRVAKGVYQPDRRAGHATRNWYDSFELMPDVVLKGGYAGFEGPDPQARDLEEYQTILSGDLNGDGNHWGNSMHVVTAFGEEVGQTTVPDVAGFRPGLADSAAVAATAKPITGAASSGNTFPNGVLDILWFMMCDLYHTYILP